MTQPQQTPRDSSPEITHEEAAEIWVAVRDQYRAAYFGGEAHGTAYRLAERVLLNAGLTDITRHFPHGGYFHSIIDVAEREVRSEEEQGQ